MDNSFKSEVEAVQTVPPSKITDPKKVREVAVATKNMKDGGLDIFGECLHVVLYYNKACEEDSGWLHAGWMKDASLAGALSEQPFLAGRLQKRKADDGGEEVMEIVSNDAGLRLVEAKIGMSLSKFLEVKKSREEAEAQLVFWNDIDGQNPQFCPLVYVQVTKFDCGGYSFGISCSLLVADLFLKGNFLKRWAYIHRKMLSENEPKTPIFYLPKLKKDGLSVIANFISSTPNKNHGQTLFFTTKSEISEEDFTALAWLCVDEAETKIGTKMTNRDYFSLFVNQTSDIIKVNKCLKTDLVKPKIGLKSQIVGSSWKDFGENEVEFREGNQTVDVSHWIGSGFGGALVMAIPYVSGEDSDVKIIVRVAN
ncbi:hypothetical protein UlMin_001545 [Ulmus minor]